MPSIMSQFGHPRGLVGHVVGMIMAVENRERIDWAVSVLKAQRGDHILEVGFGPGVAIQRLTSIVTAGFIAGIDQYEVMVQQARKRNTTAVREGRVRLEPAVGLKQLWRVLKPGGLIAIVEQPRSAATHATVDAMARDLSAQLQAVGLRAIRSELKPMRPAPAIGVLAAK